MDFFLFLGMYTLFLGTNTLFLGMNTLFLGIIALFLSRYTLFLGSSCTFFSSQYTIFRYQYTIFRSQYTVFRYITLGMPLFIELISPLTVTVTIYYNYYNLINRYNYKKNISPKIKKLILNFNFKKSNFKN